MGHTKSNSASEPQVKHVVSTSRVSFAVARPLTLRLPGKSCLRTDRRGVYWTQAYRPVGGKNPHPCEPFRAEDVFEPRWATQTPFAAACQAVVRKRPELVKSLVSPHAEGMLVSGFVPTQDAGYAREGSILPDRIWTPVGVNWAVTTRKRPALHARANWPDYLRQGYLQTHGGPAAVLERHDALGALSWLSGCATVQHEIMADVCPRKLAKAVAQQYRAGEAVVVRTQTSWLSVQRRRRRGGHVYLRLLDPQGRVVCYPCDALRIQSVCHTEGLNRRR